jgi:hypothetical protein
MEAASGFEPLHRGFADLSLNHLGTPPFPRMRLDIRHTTMFRENATNRGCISQFRPLKASALTIGDHGAAAYVEHLAGDISRFLRSEV